MQVSVVKPEQGLEYKMNVTLPAGDLDAKVEARLNEIRTTVKMDGFRPGKVPLNIVKKRYGQQVRQENLGEVVQQGFYNAIQQEALNIAGYPQFEKLEENDGQIEFTAVFEVFPEVSLPDFTSLEVEKVTSEISDKDVDGMVEKLREQKMAWKPSKSAAKKVKKGEQVIIDFVGKKEGEAFEGGSAENVPLEIGSGRMIPGFEDGLIGMKKGEEKLIELTFPEEYHAENLAGQAVTFDVTVHSISTKSLPELDEEFIKSFGVEDGSEEGLRTEIRSNMEKEISRAIDNQNRTNVLESLAAATDVELPKSAVDGEIEALMKRAAENLQQQGVKADDVNLTPDSFQDEANMRVKLGLILGDVIKANDIQASDADIESYLADQASSYEDPSEVINWYKQNPQALNEIKSILVEKQVAEMILAKAKVTEVAKGFEEVVNPRF